REIPKSPFDDKFKTAEVAHWVKPTLVVEVRFTEWTSDGLLRQPVYLGTREDKPARKVRREDARPQAAPALPANGRYKNNRRVSSRSTRATSAGTRAGASPNAIADLVSTL